MAAEANEYLGQERESRGDHFEAVLARSCSSFAGTLLEQCPILQRVCILWRRFAEATSRALEAAPLLTLSSTYCSPSVGARLTRSDVLWRLVRRILNAGEASLLVRRTSEGITPLLAK